MAKKDKKVEELQITASTVDKTEQLDASQNTEQGFSPEEISEEASQNDLEQESRNVEEVVVTETKRVNIRTSEEIDCIIGQYPYNLKKDTTYKVPSDVAAILCNSKKAYRL